MMYLQSIVINNYRPFYGENTFDFKFNDNIKFNVVSGKNGCGKSALVDALYWCLYGVEHSKKSNQLMCNYDAVDEIDVDEDINVFVTCYFIENDMKYIIQREAKFIKINDNNEIKSTDNNLFVYSINKYGDALLHNNDFISKYFPNLLFPIILFDDEYPSSFSKSYLIQIFREFSGIDVVRNVNKKLNNLLNYFSKEIKKFHDNKFILIQKKRVLDEINDVENEINIINLEIKKLNEECRIIEKELHESNFSIGGKNIGDLYNKRNKLLHERSILDERIGNLFKDNEKFTINTLPILIALSAIDEESETFNKVFENNENFKNTMFYESYSNIGKLFLKITEGNDFKDNLNEIEEIKHRIYDISSELHEITMYISAIDDSTVMEYNSRYAKYKKEISYLSHNLDSAKYEHKHLKKKLKEISRELKRFEKNKERFSPKLDKYPFCSNTLEFGNLVQKQFYSKLINEFTKEINSLFIDNFKMNDKYNRIIIKDSYEIFLIKNTGQMSLLDDLSTNERKLFNLSLIFSIHKCLQLKYPIILMDPFVNLDAEKRNLLVSFILNNLENYQILLILNENQYDDSFKVYFLSNDVNELSLINNNGNVKVFNNG